MGLAKACICWSFIGGLLTVNRTRNLSKFLNPASALLLTALILFLSVVADSPALHQLIHADASSVDHNCAVTLFVKGQISSVDLVPILGSPVSQSWEICVVENAIGNPVSDVQLIPGRAPPFC